MAKPTKKPIAEVLERVRSLLARAVDPGASEEERRTSAAIAARLMREHGIELGVKPPAPEPAADARPSAPSSPAAARVVDAFTSAVNTCRAAAATVDVEGAKQAIGVVSQVLGFDVLDFAQTLLRERVQGALEGAIKAPAPRAARPRARRRARRLPAA